MVLAFAGEFYQRTEIYCFLMMSMLQFRRFKTKCELACVWRQSHLMLPALAVVARENFGVR